MTKKDAVKILLTQPDVLAELIDDPEIRNKVEEIHTRQKNKKEERSRQLCATCEVSPDKTGSTEACWNSAGACGIPTKGFGGAFV